MDAQKLHEYVMGTLGCAAQKFDRRSPLGDTESWTEYKINDKHSFIFSTVVNPSTFESDVRSVIWKEDGGETGTTSPSFVGLGDAGVKKFLLEEVMVRLYE